jgi:hypothetical protein
MYMYLWAMGPVPDFFAHYGSSASPTRIYDMYWTAPSLAATNIQSGATRKRFAIISYHHTKTLCDISMVWVTIYFRI